MGESRAIVIGAGVAGLIAAQTLKNATFDVIVSLEIDCATKWLDRRLDVAFV
jgi:monoamine oxidase